MAIIKNKLKENFSIIPNEIITTKELKDGEYRLLLYLYHLPHNWKVNQEHLATEFDISRMQVNRRISNLKKMNYLEIKKKKVSQEEWEYDYILKIPDVSNMLHHEMLHHEMLQPNNTKYKQILTNNNTKEIYKESFFENEDLDKTFKEYLQMRYEKKCKATPTTIKSLIKKLNKFDTDTAIAMLNYSIENGYQGVFELKKDKPKNEPEWFDKEIKEEKLTKQEQEEIKEMLKEFKEEKE